MNRHRQLLNKTIFDGKDISFLMEAAKHGDVEVLQHAKNLGAIFPSQVLDQAVMFSQSHCIDFIAQHQSGVGVTGHVIQSLIDEKRLKLLYWLIDNHLVSRSGLMTFADMACTGSVSTLLKPMLFSITDRRFLPIRFRQWKDSSRTGSIFRIRRHLAVIVILIFGAGSICSWRSKMAQRANPRDTFDDDGIRELPT
jgi:hypothetical protein